MSMRVECHTIDEFLTCLEEEKILFQETVRVSVFRRPLHPGDPDNLVFDVILQASAVVIADMESQYLLDVGCDCGRDREDPPGDKGGSEKAQSLKEKIEEYAKSRGWKVLPGIINI